MITAQEHLRLAEGKMDASWERYFDGRLDLQDRYNTTVALVQGKSLLDIGCGQFLLARLLRNSGKLTMRLVGVDISSSEIAAARRLHGFDECNIEFYQQDAETLTFSPGEFDTVVLGQTLEHVRYPDRAADEALRVLRQGGRLIVNVPSDDEHPHGNHLHVYHKPGDVKDLFDDAIDWQGEGRMHNFWFLWGVKK